MGEVVSLADVLRSRRRALERDCTAECVDILQTNLALALRLFVSQPEAERPVRSRQIRQLAELLEYVVAYDRGD